MTLLNQTFEGQADGTTITVANSSTFGDDALSRTTVTSSTLTYSADVAAHGTRSAKILANTGATSSVTLMGLGAFSSNNFGARAYFNFTGRPSATTRILAPYNAAGATLGGFNHNTDGTVGFFGVGNTVLSNSSSTTQVMALNTWYRFEAYWAISATAGSYHAAVYVGDATSPWFTYTSSSTANTGTVAGAEFRIGKVNSAPLVTAPWYVDDIAVSDTATAFIGKYVPPGPVVSTTITPGWAKLDATATQPVVGGTLTYALSPTIGVVQSSPGIFYVQQGSAAANYSLTVTEAGGNSTVAPITIPAISTGASSQTSVMILRFIGGSWV